MTYAIFILLEDRGRGLNAFVRKDWAVGGGAESSNKELGGAIDSHGQCSAPS